MEGDLSLAMKMQGEEQVEKCRSWCCKVLRVSPPWTSRCHPEYLCLKTLPCPHCRLGMQESYEATLSPAALQQWLTASSLPSFGWVTLTVCSTLSSRVPVWDSAPAVHGGNWLDNTTGCLPSLLHFLPPR